MKKEFICLCFTALSFFALTYLPYILTLLLNIRATPENYHKARIFARKFVSRKWLSAVAPSTMVFYFVMFDGIGVLELEFVKMITVWAITQSVIFSVGRTFENIRIKKGDYEIILQDKNIKKQDNQAVSN